MGLGSNIPYAETRRKALYFFHQLVYKEQGLAPWRAKAESRKQQAEKALLGDWRSRHGVILVRLILINRFIFQPLRFLHVYIQTSRINITLVCFFLLILHHLYIHMLYMHALQIFHSFCFLPVRGLILIYMYMQKHLFLINLHFYLTNSLLLTIYFTSISKIKKNRNISKNKKKTIYFTQMISFPYHNHTTFIMYICFSQILVIN